MSEPVPVDKGRPCDIPCSALDKQVTGKMAAVERTDATHKKYYGQYDYPDVSAPDEEAAVYLISSIRRIADKKMELGLQQGYLQAMYKRQ